MHLSDLEQEFVLHFGEMGSRWGINRTVGQIYAVLFISEAPLNADDLVAKVGVSRSNVSMSIKELQAWNLIRLQHQQGDRRDYFTTPDDIWTIVRTLVEERKKREVDPTLSKLRELQLTAAFEDADEYQRTRIAELSDMIELMTSWYDDVKRLETEQMIKLLEMGGKIQKVITGTRKFWPGGSKKNASDDSDDTQKQEKA